ncbi:MAG TPA: sulfotransferase [Bacteroidia bacterium]|nr:sulfotransferase [Bacteroidia bacterium]
MSEFKIPPISTLIGSNILNFYKVIRSGSKINPVFYPKLILTTLVIIISTPFHVWEYFIFERRAGKFKFKKPPLFILGHWRSGTTYLHNVLCADPDAGYLTTYHSVFPNNIGSKIIFENFMKMNMPDKRPSDNVKLGVNLPQEDEFALSNLTYNSFYHFFYFPDRYRKYYHDSVTAINEGKNLSWDKMYRKLIIKALLNSGGTRAVLKNPVNTSRIQTLLRIFPEAKFIFIYRNPVTVFLSTQKFFYELFPTLLFTKVDKNFIDEMIYENFKKLMHDYDHQKGLIPKGNSIEIRFEDFEKDPLNQCEHIYNTLLKEDFTVPKIHFEKILSNQKGYSKNNYKISKTQIDKIQDEWGDYMKRWGYSLPEDLIIE